MGDQHDAYLNSTRVKKRKSQYNNGSAREQYEAEEEEEDTRREIILRNVPFSMSEAQVRHMLNDHGQVDELRLVTDKSGRSRGYAFATMHTPVDARNVLHKMRGMSLDGRKLAVQWVEQDKNPILAGHKEELTVYVSELPADVSLAELQQAFATALPRDVRHKQGRKYAYVEFNDESSLQIALALNGAMIRDTPISVARSKPRTAAPPKHAAAAAATKASAAATTKRKHAPAFASVKSADNTDSADKRADKPLSNAEFRKFLLKK